MVVGAVWTRIINDYGHVDEATPSLSISLLKEYRNLGIGTELMKQILLTLKEREYKQVSLSVQKINYAVSMYKKVGFEVVRENEEDYVMVCKL
ncbi:N-acetyltransferase [Trueperella sp. zg.1013]|uniref:GNAT family N-acetyltransferase n=1 Tax=Trueperella sp. zg.1013 TaxID=2855448 RepID=UPI001C6E74A4|nr:MULTISPECIES: N-acetyltransferase [Terrabacteria group]MBW9212416.1 GNAT family N-acetyltransferase [Trueperella sp. zg.1013]